MSTDRELPKYKCHKLAYECGGQHTWKVTYSIEEGKGNDEADH